MKRKWKQKMEKKLYKSSKDKKISGVLAGIAEYFNIDSSLVRIGYTIFSAFFFVPGIVIYAVLALVLPENPVSNMSDDEDSGDFYNYSE